MKKILSQIKNKKLIISVIIAQLCWFIMFSFVNNTLNCIKWNLQSIISFSLLTLGNSYYYFTEKNK